MENTKYRIEYHNRAYKEDNSIEKLDRDEAISTAQSIQTITEIKNVKLFEIKEIEF